MSDEVIKKECCPEGCCPEGCCPDCDCKSLGKDPQGFIDQAREKVISRKLMVFLTATGLLIWSGLDASTWGMIAMCYIGGQSAIDFAKIWKGM